MRMNWMTLSRESSTGTIKYHQEEGTLEDNEKKVAEKLLNYITTQED